MTKVVECNFGPSVIKGHSEIRNHCEVPTRHAQTVPEILLSVENRGEDYVQLLLVCCALGYARTCSQAIVRLHTENFGPPDQFGYEHFIPMSKAERFDPNILAELSKRSGAKYAIPADDPLDESYSGVEFRFATRGEILYVLVMELNSASGLQKQTTGLRLAYMCISPKYAMS